MMTKKWQPYPTYKDSGVEWLGKIPEHWEVKKLKYIFQVFNGSTPKSGVPEYWDGNIFWVTPDDLGKLKGSTIFSTERKITQSGYLSCGTKLVAVGSLVLSTRAPIGHLAITGVELCTNQGCRCLVFRYKDSIQFFYYFLMSARRELELWGQGTTFQELAKGKLESVFSILPPLPEQQKIAQFLDQETSKIDNLITKKERLIKLLKEKRTALISHAVTKGLNPDVPMKDSGVEWLGEIPEHWKVLLLKRIANIRYGLGQPPPEILYGTPLIRATNVKSGRIFQKDMIYIDPKQVPESRNAVLAAGEIIVVRSGAYTGDSALIPEEYHGSIAGYDMVTTVKEGSNQFIAWQLLSSEVRYIQFAFHQLRAAQPHLNAEELRGTIITFPPLPEQQKIAQFLDRETSKIDNLITKTRTSIDHLKEYRTALISAAVTGKIDVREH
ncbi:MAG: restriction endonuclease subunit S [Microcystis sp. M049S2]|uniref:restriction endonuclease subunit S n=1 Tax=Microcystis sp. M049S2 TaxID=2771169 RepID=UPI00258F37F3|nr:restriction endonuclease subunit S [Microcystis sp. M049S2]MCA2660585.1 restriction endonuclease subunit S [Microcystis sp. M049S2]